MRAASDAWIIDVPLSLTVDRYRLERRLGFGYEGTVYSAVELDTGIRRAIKFYWTYSVGSLRRIAKIAALFDRLSGSGAVPQYHHSGQLRVADGSAIPYLVFSQIEGPSLEALLKSKRSRRKHGVARDADLLAALCKAVAALHREGVAAGDFGMGKNVVLTSKGAPVLVDILVGTRGAPWRNFGLDIRVLNRIGRTLLRQSPLDSELRAHCVNLATAARRTTTSASLPRIVSQQVRRLT